MVTRKNSFGEYLQGALAGKLIENPARLSHLPDLEPEAARDSVVHLGVPASVPPGSDVEIAVHVRNYLRANVRGGLILRGEEEVRDVSYDFQAPLTFEEQRAGVSVVFKWRVPSYPTKIKWSAMIHFDQHMGIGMPLCVDTEVSAPLD